MFHLHSGTALVAVAGVLMEVPAMLGSVASPDAQGAV